MNNKKATIQRQRRSFSLFLAVIMLLGLLLPGASADDGEMPIAPLSAVQVFSQQELEYAIANAPSTAPGNETPTVIAVETDMQLTSAIQIAQGRNIHLLSYGTNPDTGEGGTQRTLYAAAGERHFDVVGSATRLTLSNIVLDGGHAEGEAINRGGIQNGGNVVMQANAVIEHCRATIGGAIFGGITTMYGNAEIRYNHAIGVVGNFFQGNGGGIGHGAIAMFDNARIHHNHATNNGGGVYGGTIFGACK